MNKQIIITIKGVKIECEASVSYSNCIRLEFRDESKMIFETGYKCEHLSISLTPFCLMQTIECTAVDYLERLTSCKHEALEVNSLVYSENDLELQRCWKDFLEGNTLKTVKPEFKQLKLF